MADFPDTFLWGAATAGHQIEGNNVLNDIWAMEHVEGSPFHEPSGDACDSYHRYEEDIDLLAAAGLNSYRFSIEWSRIQPERDLFSRAELEHYRRMVVACVERGVVPIVTLNHFATPIWFARSGAWSQQGAADLFERYTRFVVDALGDLVEWWVTFNEPNAGAMLLATGALPLGAAADEIPTEQLELTAKFAERVGGQVGVASMALPILAPDAIQNVFSAHRQARAAIKELFPAARVGWSPSVADYQALPGGESVREDVLAQAIHPFWELSRDDDFVGVQTYTRTLLGPEGVVAAEPREETTLTGWEYYPQALGATVRAAAAFTDRPVLITENGIATADDELRIRYTREALESVHTAIEDGVTVLGYQHWTLLDNWEWHSGFAMTFGLIAVDTETFKRTPKPSLAWLGQVSQSKGATLEADAAVYAS
ncbi:glycoside hydrolase family 1 protein [Microbacterium sp. ZW T5_56]|uniref:glycoside hydrolase family 1 protein n=1 Tax=Microbacterium sp. ZW T5_56 TaxID=3378081 RepID=UPI0038553065